MNNFSIEGSILSRIDGPAAVVGIDEVGNGAWAGPVVAGAVVLPRGKLTGLYAEIKDSKRVTALRRVQLASMIKNAATAYAIRAATAHEIDTRGLAWARARAITLAFDAVGGELPADCTLVAILDGRCLRALARRLHPQSIATNGADDVSLSVAAASIIAKVARDHLMHAHDEFWPGYGWRTNVGYGTSEHRRALAQLGPTAIHRMSVRPVAAAVR
ncbi:hypothetical protein LCGC14_0830780 [marine sediment metagenome]|uniref:Ribonuclease HII n=1 Tax=marine sediment metagenome TaxID=412755 RepID=A0A0F9SNB4_9ZZZZ